MYSNYVQTTNQNRRRRNKKFASVIDHNTMIKQRELLIKNIQTPNNASPMEHKFRLENPVMSNKNYQELVPRFVTPINTPNSVVRRVLSPKSQLKLNMHLSSQYRSNRIFNLCCCCFRVRSIKAVYATILVNDIFLSANVMVMSYIITLSWLFAMPSVAFFLISGGVYVHWQVENREFGEFCKWFLYSRWVFYILASIIYFRILYEILPIVIEGKNLEDADITEIEQEWLELINIRRLAFLSIILISLQLYLLSNLYWNYLIHKVLLEFKERKNWENKQKRKGLGMSFFNMSTHENLNLNNKGPKSGKFSIMEDQTPKKLQIRDMIQGQRRKLNRMDRDKPSFFTVYKENDDDSKKFKLLWFTRKEIRNEQLEKEKQQKQISNFKMQLEEEEKGLIKLDRSI